MFDALSDRLGAVFRKIRGQGRLDEDSLNAGLREVRLALLEADVNFKVVKDFCDRIKERALGQEVAKSLTPGQMVVKIVHEELIQLLGGESSGLDLSGPKPMAVMMVGLQGSGKTTSSAKLALWLRRHKMKPLLVPADVYRPAAIDQLTKLAGQLSMPVFASASSMNPVDIAEQAMAQARELGCDVVLIDTAGRLAIDEPLMAELAAIKERVKPREILFVADAMTGQDAVATASSFNDLLDISGVVLTKMDGDARGGAALSIRQVTGKPLKFVGVGEKLSEMDLFHPDRMASRILGMGDVLTLIEKAQSEISEEEALSLGKKLQKAEFDLEDFRTQMRRLKKLGSVEGLLKLLPGMGELKRKLGEIKVPEKDMIRTEAIINSMTMQERRKPAIITAGRRERIAKGSGTTLADVNLLLQNFENMRQMMSRMLGGGGMPAMPGMKGMAGQMGGQMSAQVKAKAKADKLKKKKNKKR